LLKARFADRALIFQCIMNYPAASSGVSKKTETFGAASGGEPSARRSSAKSPLRVTFILYVQFNWAFSTALIEADDVPGFPGG
jgi:hypothetical protein